MRRFEIDCKSGLSHEEVKKLILKPNQRVLVFQDDDEWLGTVVFDDDLPYIFQWYVKLD